MADLSIKSEMRAIDTKNRTWFNSLSEQEKKKVGLWVLMRYTSSVKHDIKELEEHYLLYTNELVNVHFNTIRHHPELQFQLLQALGLGKSMYHPWIAPGKKGTETKLYKFLKNHFSEYNDDELDIYLNQFSKEEIKEKLTEFGLDDKTIKDLTK